MKMISITDIGDFKLGNAENSEKGTGCTVIICEEGAVGGVDVRGGGPATRETDLLRSENTVNAVNAVVLSGGSAFGLEAASGVMRELADMKIGFDVGDDIVVPIVCGASLYDLPVGEKAFPDINMGVQAVRNAFVGSFANGNHGAGTGATVGKLKGYGRAMKSGLGSFACGDGIIEVGAIAAVNAVGDIYNGAGNIIAGLRSEDGESIFGTIKTLKGMVHDNIRKPDENATHITKEDIEEALAAAAKQYKEQEMQAETQANEKPVEEPEVVTEAPAEEHTAIFVFEAPSEEFAEEPSEEIVDEPADGLTEEPSEEVIEEPEEETTEESEVESTEEPDEVIEEPEEASEEVEEQNEVLEEPAEKIFDEEEFIPETPAINAFEDRYREYAEISIPVATAEPEETFEEFAEEAPEEEPEYEETPSEETAEEPEEICEEPEEAIEGPFEEVEEHVEEFEEPSEEFEEQIEVLEEPVEEVEEFLKEAPEAEPEYEDLPEEETAEEPETVYEEAEEAIEGPFEEVEEQIEELEEPSEEFEEQVEEHEEPVEEVKEFTEEAPETEPEYEEPPAEEFFEEYEAVCEEPEEEPAVLTREDMGYDIVFNTTISCLITNASLTKSQANKLASILHDAYARAIKPVHGTMDGDTVFVLATGKQKVNFDAFAALATDVMQYAIIDGAMSAEGAYGLPAAKDMR